MTYAPNMTEIAKKLLWYMEMMLGNQKIAICTIFQKSIIFELKPIKRRF